MATFFVSSFLDLLSDCIGDRMSLAFKKGIELLEEIKQLKEKDLKKALVMMGPHPGPHIDVIIEIQRAMLSGESKKPGLMDELKEMSYKSMISLISSVLLSVNTMFNLYNRIRDIFNGKARSGQNRLLQSFKP